MKNTILFILMLVAIVAASAVIGEKIGENLGQAIENAVSVSEYKRAMENEILFLRGEIEQAFYILEECDKKLGQYYQSDAPIPLDTDPKFVLRF